MSVISKITWSANRRKKYIILSSILVLFGFSVQAQTTLYPIQDFNFGSFYQGTEGGTIEISTSGSRAATGSIVLLNSGVSSAEAIFEIEAPANSMISILSGSDIQLTGSNGGTMTLRLGVTDPASPFNTVAVPPERTRIRLAGTLLVGDHNTSPAGTYQGTFSITINQE
jgi:hypothetical protein